MNVILDTNVIVSDHLIKSKNFRRLIEYCFRTMSTIVLPQIVLEELRGVYKTRILTYESQAKLAIDKLNSLFVDFSVSKWQELETEKLSNDYPKYLRWKLGSYQIDEPQYKNEYLPEIIRRAIDRIKPMSAKGEEFRDCILWLTILDYLKRNKYDEHTFISSNSADFGDTIGGLHPILKLELENSGLQLNYYKSLSEFIECEVGQFEFISKEWLITNINWDLLDERALDAVDAIHCGFFFQYLSNLGKDDFGHAWEILSARFGRDIDYFFIGKLGDERFGVELFLPGLTKVNFETETGETILKEIAFYVRISVEIFQKKVIGYPKEFFEEESSLGLHDFK